MYIVCHRSRNPTNFLHRFVDWKPLSGWSAAGFHQFTFDWTLSCTHQFWKVHVEPLYVVILWGTALPPFIFQWSNVEDVLSEKSWRTWRINLVEVEKMFSQLVDQRLTPYLTLFTIRRSPGASNHGALRDAASTSDLDLCGTLLAVSGIPRTWLASVWLSRSVDSVVCGFAVVSGTVLEEEW